jgi:hypothetical protein
MCTGVTRERRRCSCRKKHCRSYQVDDAAAGNVVKHTTQESVQTVIWEEIHKKPFYLAEEVPICQGQLCGDFGYLSISLMVKNILNGSYIYPADFDEDTEAICWECARICTLIPINSMSFEISDEVWLRAWRKLKVQPLSMATTQI